MGEILLIPAILTTLVIVLGGWIIGAIVYVIFGILFALFLVTGMDLTIGNIFKALLTVVAWPFVMFHVLTTGW